MTGEISLNGSSNLGNSLIDTMIFDTVEVPEDLENDRVWSDRDVVAASTPTKIPKDDVQQYSTVCAVPNKPGKFSSEKNSKNSKLYERAMNKKDMLSTLKKSCKCGMDCMTRVTLRTAIGLRYQYWTMTRQSRSQWLIHNIGNAKTRGRHTFHTVGKGLELCGVAFRNVHKIPDKFYGDSRRRSERDSVSTPGKSPKSFSTLSLAALSWLETYAEFYGDKMPHCKDVLLPYKSLKQSVYKQYKIDRERNGLGHVSGTQFFRLWKSHLPNIKIKQTNTFSKCTTCSSLERQLEKTMCAKTRHKLRQLRQIHNQRQMWERKYYYSKREQSRILPKEFLSLIIDGMDQSKTSLPHFTGRRAKVINPADLLKTHITGVINHGLDMFHTYVDFNQYPHDPKLTINILLQSLKKAAEKLGNELPSTLYIQADNCWRENKNKFVLSFCELLVKSNIFKEVHLSFLYVGHTHEDVDAAFSRISEKLRVTDVSTLDELIKLLPGAEQLNNMYDVKSWLEPLHYKFSSQADRFITYYKGNRNEQWISLEGNFLNSIPKGQPKPLRPDFKGIDTQKSMKQINLLKHLFKNSEDSYNWWETFYKKLEKSSKSSHQWILPKLPKQAKLTVDTEAEPLPEVLQTMLNKEVRTPEANSKEEFR